MNRRFHSISPLLALIFPLLLLPGCSSGWDPFSPVSRLWEGADEEEAPAATAADPMVEQSEPVAEGDEDVTGQDTEVAEEVAETSPAGSGVPSDLRGVRWLHTDVSGWRETGNLRAVRVSGGSITLDYDKARSWPGVNHSGATVNANPWIFVEVNGTWYAATWEWLRVGQTTKAARSVAGDHIKKSPLNGFRPRSGEEYGFMVSGLARDAARNVRERTQVVMYRWP